MKQSSEIELEGPLETTFYWPLALDLPPHSDEKVWRKYNLAEFSISNILALEVAKLEGSQWQQVDGLAHWQPPNADSNPLEEQARQYSEFTYFHDFIQRFLYAPKAVRSQVGTILGLGQDGQEAVRLFVRNDITACEVDLADDETASFTIACSVLRLSLSIFATGIAVLSVTLSALRKGAVGQDDTKLTLAEAMTFNDRMRRAHAPYLQVKPQDEIKLPRNAVPLKVRWTGNGEKISHEELKAYVTGTLRKLTDADCRNAREVGPLPHWSVLLPKEWRVAPSQAKNVTWRHVTDERLPILSTIVLQDAEAYRAISPGDWYRLCHVDPPANDAYPFSKKFLEKGNAGGFYDRFHFEGAEIDSELPPVRYLISPHSFIAVGSGPYFKDHIREHMQRHYHQLMLLAQMEFSSLLAFSSRITLAVTDYDSQCQSSRTKAAERFHHSFRAIERDFLDFVHRFRFTGVSSQIQARELHERIRDIMGLDRLFADIKEEVASANNFMARDAQEKQSRAAEGLNLIATMGVVLGLAFSVVSLANPPNAQSTLPGGSLVNIVGGGAQAYWALVLAFVGGANIVGALMAWLLPKMTQRRQATRLTPLVLATVGFLAGVGSLVLRWPA